MNYLRIIVTLLLCLYTTPAMAASIIFSEGYENGLSNWHPFSQASSIVNNFARSGSSSLRSDRSLGAPQTARSFTFPSTRKLYLSFWVYVTPGSADMMGKWARFITQGGGREAQMEFWATGQRAQMFWYTRHDGGQSCGITGGPVGASPGSLNKGQWNRFEVFIEYNDPGISNGRVRQWINRPTNTSIINADAYKTADQRNVKFADSGQCGAVYETLHLPTGYSSGSPVIYFDDVELWDDLPEQDQGSTPPPADNPPVANITAPSSSSSFTSDQPSIDLGGTASDDRGLTLITWENCLGGQGRRQLKSPGRAKPYNRYGKGFRQPDDNRYHNGYLHIIE